MSAPIFPLQPEVRKRLGLAPLGTVVSPRLKAALREVLHAILGQLNELIDEEGNLPPRPTATLADLTPKGRKLFEATTDQPQSAKRIAKLAKFPMNSDTERIFADLVRQRYLVRLPEGYVVAD